MSKLIPITLANPHLDQGFRNYDDIPELSVARGWTPWWLQGTEQQTSEGYYKRPEYKPETIRFLSGGTGQKFFTTFGTHDAGMCQTVDVPKGVMLYLTAQVQYYSLHTDGKGGGYGMQVGIDPWGGTDPWSTDIVWGEWHGQDDPDGWDGRTWKQVTTKAMSHVAQVTIHLRGTCRFRAKHNDSYWDEIALFAEVADEPPPEPGNGDLTKLIEKIEALANTIAEGLAALNDSIQQVIDKLHIT